MIAYRNLMVSAALAGALLGTATQAGAYDLRADWSDASNPNGPWSYREGSIVLPHSPSWTTGGAFPVVQPAYQPANRFGNFLPAWFKIASNVADFDTQIGDIVVHTNDIFNGNPSLGRANVLFTVPVTGVYDVSGSLWNANTKLVPADFRPRPQDWEIIINGVVFDSGVLDAVPGHFTRASPDRFELAALSLNAGDRIELDVFQDPAARAGFFVGVDLKIVPTGSPTSVPVPATASLLVAGLLGLGVARGRSGERQEGAGVEDA